MGRRITLTGSAEAVTCKMISGKRLHKLLKSKWMQVAQLFLVHAIKGMEDTEDEGNKLNSVETTTAPWEVTQLESLNVLLDEFEDLLRSLSFYHPQDP